MEKDFQSLQTIWRNMSEAERDRVRRFAKMTVACKRLGIRFTGRRWRWYPDQVQALLLFLAELAGWLSWSCLGRAGADWGKR